jgi:hypothetical protein
MESRKSEIENLTKGFVASLQFVITGWRGVEGVDVLKHFESGASGNAINASSRHPPT